MGLYLVLWGKSEEKKLAKEQIAIVSAAEHVPRPTSHSKNSLSQPLITSSTENNV